MRTSLRLGAVLQANGSAVHGCGEYPHEDGQARSGSRSASLEKQVQQDGGRRFCVCAIGDRAIAAQMLD